MPRINQFFFKKKKIPSFCFQEMKNKSMITRTYYFSHSLSSFRIDVSMWLILPKIKAFCIYYTNSLKLVNLEVS